MAEGFKSNGGYWLIDTIVDVSVDLPLEVIPNVRLERATDEQIELLKNRIRPSNLENPIAYGREYAHVLKEQKKSSTTWMPVPLPREKWRYFLFTFAGNGYEFHKIYRLCCVVDPPFEFRFVIHTTGEYGTGEPIGWGGQMPSPLNAMRLQPAQALVITQDTISDLRTAYSQLYDNAVSHPDLERAVGMFHDIRLVPNTSGLYFLGLFSVLELLLTHNPQDRENADSLNHQLSTKIPLIDKRLPSKIDYSEMPDMKTEGGLWKTLYAYRSAIAHGENPDFTSKLQILKSPDIARDLVQQACRKLLRHALREPVLFRDLKAV